MSVSGYMLQAMLETKCIVQPTKLNAPQTTALRAVNKILSGGSKANDSPLLRDAAIRKMKSCTLDTMSLLIDGKVTQLRLIDDEDIVVDMEHLLGQFDLERQIDDMGGTEFKLPEEESRSRSTCKSLKYILDALIPKARTIEAVHDDPSITNERTSNEIETSHSDSEEELSPNINM